MKHLLLSFFLIPVALYLPAQGTTGTEFWLGYMENLTLVFNGPPDFVLQIHAEQTAEGFVEVPATGLSIPFDAVAGTVTEVTLPAATWYSEGSEFIDNKGIRITSDVPINVTAIHYRVYFSEATRLLSTPELGDDYLVTCYPDVDNNSPTTFVVVSTEDGTEVEITPSTLTQGLQPAGIPFTVTLNEGQTYQVKASGDLSGTRVRSLGGEPLAVFSGAQQGNIGPCIGGADSHIYDQQIPVADWEDTYFFVPFSGQGSDPVRFLGSVDGTTVFFNCLPLVDLDEGEVAEIALQDAGLITSTHPISVAQFNSSQDCNPSGVGDPNMLQLFPASRRFNDLRVFIANGPSGNSYVGNHFFNLVTETAGIGGVTLDGNSLSAAFTPFSAFPEYSYAQIPVNTGQHLISSSTTPLWGTRYSFGDYDALTANLGYSEEVVVDVACLEIEAEGLYCVDSTITFSALANGEVASYAWDLGNTQTSSLAEPATTYTTPGIYLVTLTVTYTDGSTGMTQLELEIFDCPEEPCVEPDIFILPVGDPCTGITFSVLPSLEFESYLWDFGNGSISEESMPTTSYPAQGVYSVSLEVTDAFNCSYTYNIKLVVPDCNDPCGGPDVTIFMEGTPCVDSVLTFYTSPYYDPDSPPVQIDWFFSNGDNYFQQDTIEVTFSQAGIYQLDFYAFVFPFCDYFGFLEFEIFDDCSDPCINQPPLSISTTGVFCIDSTLSFSAQTDADLVSYQWTFNTGEVITDPVATTSFPNEQVYSVTLEATDVDGCFYQESLFFDIANCPCQEPAEVSIEVSGELCVSQPISFTATSSVELVSWNWDFGDSGESPLEMPTYEYSGAGNYTVIVQGLTADGCTYSAQLVLEIEPCLDPCLFNYEVDILAEGTFCPDSVITLTAVTDVPNPVEYNWSGDGLINGTGDVVSYTSPLPGMFGISLTIIDEEGCSWQGTTELLVEECISPEDCGLFFPNAFSPNGDGVNDRFGAFYDCRPDNFRLLIFDRWGNLVFEATDSGDRWDGTNGSQDMPQAVYAWRAVYDFGGEMLEEYGDVTLLR